MRLLLLSVILIVGSVISETVFACASCGSGGEDPLILYPNENWKGYLSFARTGEFETIDTSGEAGPDFGPTTRNTTTVAFGHSFSQRWFATLTAPYVVNRRDEFDRSSWGDPLVASRYTVVQQTLAEEWIPQVQVLASYRPSYATSKYDSQDIGMLDVFGIGVPEGRMGVDVWSGMNAWKGGVAQTMTLPVGERDTDFGRIKPGMVFRSVATFGYGWGDSAKLLGGLSREQVTASRVNGVVTEDSASLAHGFFVTVDGRVERHSVVRATWTKAASLFANRNTSRNQSFTMAVIRSF